MVILNLFGKIQPICLSNKLKLYIANVPNDIENDWNKTFVTEMKASLQHAVIEHNKFAEKPQYNISDYFKKSFLNKSVLFV